MNKVFGLDIGTRNIVGTVGYLTEDDEFNVVAQCVRQHETRAMLDGQIHDIGRVARTISAVKAELEEQIGEPLPMSVSLRQDEYLRRLQRMWSMSMPKKPWFLRKTYTRSICSESRVHRTN